MPSSVKLIGLDVVYANLKLHGVKTIQEASKKSGKLAADMENKAKRSRTWTDQTGNARRSITGSHESKTGSIIVALAIGVDYGKYLELGHGGRFAVVKPTINEYRRKYMQEFKGILK